MATLCLVPKRPLLKNTFNQLKDLKLTDFINTFIVLDETRLIEEKEQAGEIDMRLSNEEFATSDWVGAPPDPRYTIKSAENLD